MGLKIAVASGNWSNPATWNGGTLPQAGDVVASNNFTVTIDQNVNVDSITNSVTNPASSIPVMTGYTSPSGIVTASSEYLSASGDAWKAFDNNTGSSWISANGSGSVGWLAYEFPTPRNIVGYTISNPNSSIAFPKDWTFEGWNGTSWVVLHTVIGNTNTSTYSASVSNSTSYIKYRINITANNGSLSYSSIGEFKMYVPGDSLTAAVAGGGFTLNSGVTVTCTNTTYGLLSSTSQVTLLTYSGLGIATINAAIAISPSNNASFPTLLFTGSGTLNINGTMKGFSSQSGVANNSRTLILNGSGTVNIVGNIETSYIHDAPMITTSNNVTVNHTGDIYTVFAGGNSGRALDVGLSTWTTTGTITGLTRSSISQVNIASNGRFYHIGTIAAGSSGNGVINNSGFAQLNSIMNVGVNNQVCLRSDSSSAINLCTGPFVCSTYGFVPLQVVRMHLIPNAASYFEFRDETTNGAVFPGAIAPAARLVSPGGAVDAPIPANVRSGISYASGTLLGTMIVPSPSNVANNVPVDNTVGTAVLDPNAIWSVPLASINTLNSIGRRVKNAATVETTGAQIESILNSL